MNRLSEIENGKKTCLHIWYEDYRIRNHKSSLFKLCMRAKDQFKYMWEQEK